MAALKPLPSPDHLDLDRIMALADELGSPDPALRFISKYLCMLPGRMERIVTAIEHGDPAETTTAVLSLKVASSMVGAVETETQCQALEKMIREDHLDDAACALPALHNAANRCLAAHDRILAAARTTLGRAHRFHQS